MNKLHYEEYKIERMELKLQRVVEIFYGIE